MSKRTTPVDERLHDYLVESSVREPEILARLRAETAELGDVARMQISPEQGQFMALLVRSTATRRVLEVGTFTGYSSLRIALALPTEGRIVACDVNEEWTGIARRYWQEAGVADKIDLRLGPALETLDALLESGEAESFDFAFIDADKGNYVHYYERAYDLVRPGGLIGVDNVLWHGDVADPENLEPDTVAIRTLNQHIAKDGRVEICMVPIGDGLTLARKL